MEYIKVILLDLPVEIDGRTVDCGNDTYIIMLNARLNDEQHCKIYDREVNYINDGNRAKMLSLDMVSELQANIAV